MNVKLEGRTLMGREQNTPKVTYLKSCFGFRQYLGMYQQTKNVNYVIA